MSLRSILALPLVASLAWAPAPLVAGSVTTLAPVTPWSLDYSPTSCVLRRGFGDKAKPDLLMIEQFSPSNTFQLLLASKALPFYEQGRLVKLRYGEGADIPVRGALPGSLSDRTRTLTISRTALVPLNDRTDDAPEPTVTPQQEAAATSVSVEYSGRTVLFATGRLDRPFASMRKCTDDLVRSWGLDPAQQAARSVPVKPRGDPARWITSEVYPTEMIRAGKQALVNFRLIVDENGVPSACEIQRSYNDPIFDKITCQLLMRRGRFSPALDAAGKPIASYYLNRVLFIMP